MSVDRETVRRVARLARIAEPEDRLEPLAKELSDILNWIEQLNEIDTDNVEPMTSAVETMLAWRKDDVTDGKCQSDILNNAPNTRDDFFTVPKVVE
jgi:aspartyl-tRNA(Asn)/glutamyl-tRNA(Gln) amidotransferase subunit C